MNATEAKRFHKHFHFILDVPDEGINMENWFTNIEEGGVVNYPPQNQDAHCGTAACVAGWLPIAFPDDWIAHRGFPELISQLESPDAYDPASERVICQFKDYFGVTFPQARCVCGTKEVETGETLNKSDVLNRMLTVAGNNGWDIAGGSPVPLESLT